MAKTKYIVVEDFPTGISLLDVIFPFPEFIGHDDFARMVTRDGGKVISAGFVSMPDEYNPKGSCHGKSVSLDLKSRGEVDTKMLESQILGVEYW